MKPNTFTISVFFQRERRYLVPLFQRSYVWQRQWKPLWEDIKTIALQLLEGSEHGALRHLRNHFLGAVVLSKIDTFGHQVVADEIIDGQQRLTTIQIFLVALRDYLKNSAVDISNRNWLVLKKVTENELFDDTSEQYKVWPTVPDRKVFQDIFSAGSPDSLEKKHPKERYKYSRYYKPRHRMVDAYLYFYRVVSEFIDGKIEDHDGDGEPDMPVGTMEQRSKALIDALTLNFEIVVIELEEKDDPQTIFQTLNYLGEPLLPSDLIRNFVFLEAMRQNKPVEALYNQYWLEYYNPETGASEFWNAEIRQGRLKRPTFDLFIYHYLIQKTQQEIPVTYLFQEFRDWWLSESGDVEARLKDIQEQSHVFKRFLAPKNNARVDMFARRLRIMDNSTVYPLVLFLFGEKSGEISESDLVKIAIDIESFLIRRMVCGLTTKNYNRLFLSLLKDLKDTEKTPALTHEAFRNLLLAQEGDSVRWPDDKEFEMNWLSQPIYKTAGPSRVRMMLDAIDLAMHTSRQENVPLEGEISVEHVMPQNMSAADWGIVFPPDANEQTQFEITKRRENFIQTFGNLTLITGPLNSENKDHPFSEKRPRLTKKSKLMLNNYFQDFKNEDVWAEAQIEERGQALFKTALKIWPR